MKVKVLLGTATIALVGFVGAVHTVLGQDMPDVPQTSVVPVVEAVEQPQVPEFQETVEVETIVTAPVATEKVEQATIDDRPEWRKYLDEKKTLGGDYAVAVECIDNWENYLNAESTFRLKEVSDFRQADDAIRNLTVVDTFSHVYKNRPCASRVF